jgi:hypothetical protein
MSNEEKKNDEYKNKHINEWDEVDVQNWFLFYNNGIFKDYAKKFFLYDGKSLSRLNDEQFIKILDDNSIGILLYQKFQEKKEGNLHLLFKKYSLFLNFKGKSTFIILLKVKT